MGCAKALSLGACISTVKSPNGSLLHNAWAGYSTIAQHFYPPLATALEIVPFGFKFFFEDWIASASASGLRFGVVPFCFKWGGDLKGIKKGLPMGNPFFVVIVL